MSVLEQVSQSGVLKGVLLDLYTYLSAVPTGMTIGELHRTFKSRNPKTLRSRNEIAKRVLDLQEAGAVYKKGTTICPVTGRTVAVYFTTSDMPHKVKRGAPMVVTNPIGARLKILEAENHSLRKEAESSQKAMLDNTGLRVTVNVLETNIDMLNIEISDLRANREALKNATWSFLETLGQSMFSEQRDIDWLQGEIAWRVKKINTKMVWPKTKRRLVAEVNQLNQIEKTLTESSEKARFLLDQITDARTTNEANHANQEYDAQEGQAGQEVSATV
jgi:hypothetical protein